MDQDDNKEDLSNDRIAAVVIGRNEGERLVTCLKALVGNVDLTIYVDSGSSDNSIENARNLGAKVIELDTTIPFTAARARNAGVEALQGFGDFVFVQFIDGDCETDPDWIKNGQDFLGDHFDVAAVCGRLRERFPEATLWNGLLDEEWAAPTGQIKACGGNVLMRLKAFNEAGGFVPQLIAGEEPELCVRLRARGWKIWRLNAEMALHDAAMTRFSQWWQRSRRAGYTYAEGVAMHGKSPERHNVQRLMRTLFWGCLLPVLIVVGVLFTPFAILLVMLWPLQIFRLTNSGMPLRSAFFMTFAKFAEMQGVLTWCRRRLTRGPAQLIEYK